MPSFAGTLCTLLFIELRGVLLQGSMLLILHILLQLWLEALYLPYRLVKNDRGRKYPVRMVLVSHANLSLISCIGVGTVQISRVMLHP